MNDHSHLGAYSLVASNRRLLHVRKCRGPYIGMLDLPGGSIEFGESPEQAVIREVKEETGLTVSIATLIDAVSTVFEYTVNTEDRRLHHVGFLYQCGVTSTKVTNTGDGQDSAGALWIDFDQISELPLTPFAKLAAQTQQCTLG